MFKRLRERIAEEATKFPVGQLNSNTGKQSDSENKATGANSTEDLITLSDSSAVVVPHTSSQQFSIGEDEDGSVSEQSTPQKKQTESANGSVSEHSFYSSGARDHPAGTGADLSFSLDYRPTKSNYIPQSDIESEREEPPTLNLESISKDQLLTAIELLKARAYKYKNKYVEVVKNYRELRDEKLKIENTLIEQQDKGLRRIAELREQCQLEQKAKAHLEANLRLLLEEKDSRITVLETQINFLKENIKADSLKTPSEISDTQNSDASSGDTQSDSSTRDSSLEEKLERLEHQFNQAKKTITSQTDQISLLRKQNEGLSQELEEKMKRLNEMEDEQGQLKSKHEFILQGMQNRLKELENQQEESVMSMAETKKNMHEELELKEKQLIKAEEEAKQYQATCEAEKTKVLELQKQYEEKINNLQHQLESTERMLEDEKQNLMQELGRGKSAAIALMQQECAKKITAIEEEWKSKLQDLQKEKESAKQSKEEVSEKKMKLVAEEVKQQKQQIEELNSVIEQLEKENSALKHSLEKLESDFTFCSTKFEKLQTEYSDLKELNEKEKLQYGENLKHTQELANKLQRYQNSESELRSQNETLKGQLNAKQNIVDDMMHNKNTLYNQINALENKQEQLIDETKHLKKEVEESHLKLQNLTTEWEKLAGQDILKNKEIDQLQENLRQLELIQQSGVEKLTECKKEILKLESEKNSLVSEVHLLNICSEETRNKLLATENEVAFLKGTLDESSSEFGLLKKCLDEKLRMFEIILQDYVSMGHSVTSLEKEHKNLKVLMKKHKTVCKGYREQIYQVVDYIKYLKLQAVNESNVVSCSTTDKNMNGNSHPLLMENYYKVKKAKSVAERSTKEMEYAGVFENNFSSSLEKYDLNSCDVKELHKIVQHLADENRKLKEDSEIQNVEFAKNITQLHESLGDLQEERNNLSLVLQSIETQSQEINPVFEKSSKFDGGSKNDANLPEQVKESESKLDIMELNNKVKSEIAALSAQTEMINHELQALREQFSFSQLTYSEKVLQLNSKLTRRTEQLLSVKEELDVSMQNAEGLKCLLESMKEQLAEKDELIDKNKEEFESKCKALKENSVEKELSLKQLHLTQLTDLKDQTKATIDKLNGEIRNLNACLKKKEEDYELNLSNMKEQCNQELQNLAGEQKLLLQLGTDVNKIFSTSKNFEVEFLNNLNKFDIYNSRICSLNLKLNCIMVKLQEKENIIQNQQCKISDMESHIKILNQENEDLKDLKNKVNEISSLYEKAVSELEKESNCRKKCESDVLTLKETHKLAIKELENVHCSSEFENEKLKSLLQESSDELQTLKEKCTEMEISLKKSTTELNDSKSQSSILKELQKKYDSLLKNYELVCKNLEVEKMAASNALNAVSEWKLLYDSMLSSFNGFAEKSYENMGKIAVGLDQKDTKLKSFESQFLKYTALCKSQKFSISDLRDEIVGLNEANRNLLEKIQDQEDIAESKFEICEQKIKEVTEENNTLKLQLQAGLNSAESDLKSALAEKESISCELKKKQDSLVHSLKHLEESEKRLKEETDRLSVVEKAAVEWEEKYNTVFCDAKRMTDSLKSTEDSLKSALQQIEEYESKITLMVPKEKLDSCEKIYADRLNKLQSEIQDLQENIDKLSTCVKEKEHEIEKIQTEKDNVEVKSEECLKSLKDKLETAEKNYVTQMDEMKSRILVLEEEKCALKMEKSELLKVQEKFKTEESAVSSELKLKEDELCKLRQNYEISNKEQLAKIHSFQETMKDKENMIVKLIANLESLKQENSDKNEELKRKICKLEEEREHLMIQAQERVSNTEAKCREDIKALQEKNNKLLVENSEIEKLNNKISLLDKQLSESRRLAESNETAAREEIALLRNQLAKSVEKLSEAERKKLEVEAELSKKVRKLEEENSSLLGKTNHFESLKAEKEELNEKLKQAEQQVTSIKTFETEMDTLKNENTTLLKELELLKSSQPDDESLQDKIESLKENEEILRDELEELRKNKKVIENELSELRASFEKERETLISEIEKLRKQISLLEKMSSDPQSTASKDYIAVIRGECETAIKAKEEEMETKLKHLVRDFCIQMDVKDNDCDKMMSELLEKNQDLEEKLMREHRKEVAELRQNLFEQECAFEETRDNYEKTLQEKEKEVKELQSTIKKLMGSSHYNASSNDVPITAESSDWDDTWAVPEEGVENASPVPNSEQCKEHLQQIESLQNEVTKCNSEIKELKILLRLSPPESMPNNIRKDPSQSIPEPTEFEYLKNIIYEYMMGKEPITLAKVIAAVLRFSDTQTQQVIRREEARHPTMTHWLRSK